MTLEQRIQKEIANIKRKSDKAVDKALHNLRMEAEAREHRYQRPPRHAKPAYIPPQDKVRERLLRGIDERVKPSDRTGYCTCWEEKEIDGVMIRARRVIIDNGRRFNPTCGHCLIEAACAIPAPQRVKRYDY